jgi:hypothetical protein
MFITPSVRYTPWAPSQSVVPTRLSPNARI